MTIKEMEECSGMERSNIRFYEKEGLILPARQENGYRDYSEEDLQELLRIKLLRSLHISLEEIKGLQGGQEALVDVMERQMVQLEQKGRGLRLRKQSVTICARTGQFFRSWTRGGIWRSFTPQRKKKSRFCPGRGRLAGGRRARRRKITPHGRMITRGFRFARGGDFLPERLTCFLCV